jgi:DNA-binding transcriptional LysR family regulator
MAQQPLSAAIKNLEAELGFDLFERVANRLHLTPAGVAFLVQARTLLSAAEAAVECGRRVARGESGVLRIGYCSAAMGRVLPPAIASFREQFPAIALRLRRMDQAVQLAALERDDLDLASVYRPFDERGRSSSDVLEERLVLLVPRTHELAEREAIGIDQLAGLPLIRLSSDATRPWRLAADHLFADAAFKPEYVDEVADGETAIGLVAAGIGATILTEHA